jgi:ferredoxin
MADISQKWKENKTGKMFVDQSCIACDACVLSAPKNFAMHEEDGHAFVSKQPESPEEEAACKEAMEGCPVEAIGDFGVKLAVLNFCRGLKLLARPRPSF